MEKQRNSFVFYRDWYNTICELDDTTALEICKAIMSVAFNENMPKLSNVANAMMLLIRPQLERDIEKYKDTIVKRSNAGKKHRGNQYVTMEQMEHNGTNGTSVPTMEQMEHNGTNGSIYDNVNVNVNDNVDNNNVILKEIEDKSSTKKKPKTTFIPPTLDEVEAYIKEKGYHFNAKAFIDYYAADDWHLGRGASRRKVSNWKRCCVTWEDKRTSNNGLFAQDEPQQDENEILLKRIYETMPESEQAKILQLDPYAYHMLPEKGKNMYREKRKQLMLDWLKEHNE